MQVHSLVGERRAVVDFIITGASGIFGTVVTITMPRIVKSKQDGIELRQRIEQLYVMGASQCQIAERVGVSQPRVNVLLQEIRQEWRSEGPRVKEELLVELHRRYSWVIFEAKKAYERSKKNKEEIIVEEPLLSIMQEMGKNGTRKDKGAKEELQRLKRLGRKTTKTSGRIPAAQFLQIMNDVNKALREMHGIDAPTKVQAQVASTMIPWADVALAAQHKATPEEIVQKLTTEQFPDAVEADEYEGTEFEKENT